MCFCRTFMTMLLLLVTGAGKLRAQTLGGQATYQFLSLPAAPQVSALGGMSVAQQSDDLSLAFQNPALLSEKMHTHTALNFNNMYAGVRNYHWMLAYHHPRWKVNFAGAVHFFDYGNVVQTDAAGNTLGAFRPRDYVVQLTASKNYLQRWRVGLSVKFIASDYVLYRSQGIAMDAGWVYRDTANYLQIAVVAKNMGVQWKTYAGVTEELPFDVRAGISKRLANAPLQFSATYHHVHRFDIFYNDTLFNTDNDLNSRARTGAIQKFFQHLVIGMQWVIGQRIELSAGYNFLRRAELNVPNAVNGLNGFGLGVGVLLPKLQLRYARSHYQNNTAYNQLGLTLPLNQYIGLGSWGEKIGW